MTYYCLECKKRHADGYKMHWKYKSGILEVLKEPPHFSETEMNSMTTKNNSQYIDELEKRIVDLEDKQEAIITILQTWKQYIDRKHPYAHIYQKAFDDLL